MIEKRYHKQTMHDKKQINNEMTSQKIKNFCKKKDLRSKFSTIVRLTFALDFIFFRTYDVFHSE